MIHLVAEDQEIGANSFPGKEALLDWATHHRHTRGPTNGVSDPSWNDGAGPFQLAVLVPDLSGPSVPHSDGEIGLPYLVDRAGSDGYVGLWPWDDNTLWLELPGYFEP